jgi:hypothetical protein
MAAWSISLLVTVYYLIVGRAWRVTGFVLVVASTCSWNDHDPPVP